MDKTTVTEFAGGVLEAQLAGGRVFADISAAGEEWQVMLRGKLGDEALVGIGIVAAKLVVEVCDEEDQA